jgi:O-antigen ligase
MSRPSGPRKRASRGIVALGIDLKDHCAIIALGRVPTSIDHDQGDPHLASVAPISRPLDNHFGREGMYVMRRLPIRERIVCALLVLSVSLGALLNVSGVGTSERELVLVALLIGTILALPGGRLRTTPGRLMAVLAFALCVVVSYLRFAAAPIAPFRGRDLAALALMIILVTAFALCSLLAPTNKQTHQRRLLCALFSPMCFVLLNLSLYVVGFHFPIAHSERTLNNGSAQLLGLIGIHTTRASLPLTPGLNGAGEAAALALVICAVLAHGRRGRLRLLSLVGVAVSVVSVLLTDSRGPLAYALLALILLTFLPKAARRIVVAVPVLLPISPVIILFVVGHLGSVSESLNRNPGKGSFETATGRSQIWSIVAQFLSHPNIEDLFGYGAYGQVRSGVSYQYAYLFRYNSLPEFTSVHNIALQTILDMGYIGLALFLWFLIVAINSARKSREKIGTPESSALLVALIALSLFGASEALPGLAGIYLLVSAIVLSCAAIREPALKIMKPRPLRHAAAPYRTPAPRVPDTPKTVG